jgi:hypothetical protein
VSLTDLTGDNATFESEVNTRTMIGHALLGNHNLVAFIVDTSNVAFEKRVDGKLDREKLGSRTSDNRGHIQIPLMMLLT